MKILIINTLFPPHKIGGAEKSVFLLASGLVKAGHDVAVATLDDRQEPTTETTASGLRVYRLPMDNVYWPFSTDGRRTPARKRLEWHLRNMWNTKAARRLTEVVDREQPDLVHCNLITGFSPSILRMLKSRKIPIVQTLRDYGMMCSRSALFRDGKQCASWCFDCALLTLPAKLSSRHVDQLVSNSQYVIDAHHRSGYFPNVPSRRIFNIVNLEEGGRGAAPPEDAIVFGFIGRVEAEKGIEVVLKASRYLVSEDWSLKIAGIGEQLYVERLKGQYSDRRIEWLGYCDSADFFRSIDVSLIASIWPEPLPRTLIESIAHGIGAICSSAGGIPEIAEKANPHVIYEATDPTALAKAMQGCIDNKSLWRMRTRVDEETLNSFSESRIVEAYLEVFKQASGASVGPRKAAENEL